MCLPRAVSQVDLVHLLEDTNVSETPLYESNSCHKDEMKVHLQSAHGHVLLAGSGVRGGSGQVLLTATTAHQAVPHLSSSLPSSRVEAE